MLRTVLPMMQNDELMVTLMQSLLKNFELSCTSQVANNGLHVRYSHMLL